jgi:medium-chain acyl-[acyl-carrier-protein] hydrolase
MSSLVEAAALELRPYIDRPYAVFGHSVGALAGFEWARALRQLGFPEPVHLVVAARRAPHLRDRRTPIAHLPQTDFIAAACERYNGIPGEVLQSPELLDLLVPTLRADIQLLESYVYMDQPSLKSPITAFMGREDAEATLSDIEGWREHTTAGFQIRTFDGDHFFLQSAQAAVTGAVATIVSSALDGTISRMGSP